MTRTFSSHNVTASARMHAVQTPVIPAVAALIADTPGTISLGQGIAHYPPPPEVGRALAHFGQNAEAHVYQPVTGTPELKNAIQRKLASDNNIDVDAERIVVTAGANMAFNNALLAVASQGDEIILLAPYYFNHEMAITMADCVPVVVPTDAQYQPDLEAIRAAITPRSKAVVTVSPNNPTGAVYPADSLKAINDLCAEHGLYHISDETYEYFTYDGATHTNPLEFAGASPYTISIYSLSKAYGFASWRIGYMVIPEQLKQAVEKIQDTVLICPPVVSQVAATAALEVGKSYCEPFVAGYADVRTLVLEQLAQLADFVSVPQPDGAFYCLLNCDLPLKPMQVVQRLIREFGVAVIPGDTFGIDGCYLRISYGALDKDSVDAGIGRLCEGLRVIAGGSSS